MISALPNNYWVSYRKKPSESWEDYFLTTKAMNLAIKVLNADSKGQKNCVTVDLLQDKYYAKACEDKLAYICQHPPVVSKYDYTFWPYNATTFNNA